MAEKVERKGYSTIKWKANRMGYQAEVIIAMENTGRVGDEILVRGFLSTITIKCGCSYKIFDRVQLVKVVRH